MANTFGGDRTDEILAELLRDFNNRIRIANNQVNYEHESNEENYSDYSDIPPEAEDWSESDSELNNNNEKTEQLQEESTREISVSDCSNYSDKLVFCGICKDVCDDEFLTCTDCSVTVHRNLCNITMDNDSYAKCKILWHCPMCTEEFIPVEYFIRPDSTKSESIIRIFRYVNKFLVHCQKYHDYEKRVMRILYNLVQPECIVNLDYG